MSSTAVIRALALGLCFQVAPPLLAPSHAADSAAVPASQNPKATQVFKLSGTFSEVEPSSPLFGAATTYRFGELLTRLETLGASPFVDTIVLRLENLSLGAAQTEELTRTLKTLKDQKKRIFVHADRADLRTLHLLSVATQSAISPEGSLTVLGFNLEVAHYNDLFSAIGVQADLIAVGEFKSALEPFTRTELSPQARENYETLLDGLYQEQIQQLSKARKLKPEHVRQLIDKGLLSAEEAKRRKLIDKLSTWSAFLDEASQADSRELAWPISPETPDFSDPFALFKTLSSDPNKESTGVQAPKIAVLNAEGAITEGRSAGNLFGSESSIASEDVLDTLHTLAQDANVKALVVRINSPGGSALASDLIWQELSTLNKRIPVIVSLGDTAASGGYYIASAGRHIYAEPSTLTGSIGVFGGKLVLAGLLEKVGITTTRISRGENASLFSSTTPFTEAQRELVHEHMQTTYRTFVNRVAKGRNMSFDAVEKLARGRVYTGRQALEIGLVDKLGGLQDAIAEARKLAKLEASAPVENWPKSLSLFEMLNGTQPSPRIEFDLMARLPPALRESIRSLTGLLQMPSSLHHGLALSPWVLWP